MAVTLGSETEHADVMMEINTTPLIDVMLVLLVMLIITIPIQTHAVKLDLPSGVPPAEAAPPPPPVVVVDVDFDGTILWNAGVVPDRKALEGLLLGAARAPVQPEVHLRPNKLAAYRHVATVMAEAQRLGVTRIGLIGNEQFLD